MATETLGDGTRRGTILTIILGTIPGTMIIIGDGMIPGITADGAITLGTVLGTTMAIMAIMAG